MLYADIRYVFHKADYPKQSLTFSKEMSTVEWLLSTLLKPKTNPAHRLVFARIIRNNKKSKAEPLFDMHDKHG